MIDCIVSECKKKKKIRFSELNLYSILISDNYWNLPDPQQLVRSACYHCGKTYRFRATLNRHLRYECGKEPMFACPMCPKRCSRKSNLHQHIRIRHKSSMVVKSESQSA